MNRLTTPGQRLLLVICLHGLLWSLMPWLVNHSLPLDVVREGLSWGLEFEWGYHKHPPLPSWLVEISFRLGGTLGPYLLSQLYLGATLWLVYCLGCRLLDPARAAAGALLLLAVPFFSWNGPEFNHNVAQMPLWIAGFLLLHQLSTQPRLRDWLLLALVCAAGVLSKYAFLVPIGLMVLWLLLTPQRRLLLSPGFGLALLLFLLLLVPHAFWLVQNDFLPFQYLEERAEDARSGWEHLLGPLRFLGTQLLNLLLLPVIAFALGWRPQRLPPAYLSWFALMPLVVVVALGWFTREEPRDMWAVPMLSLAGLWLVAMTVPADWPGPHTLRRLAMVMLTLSLLVASAYAGKAIWGEDRAGKPSRTGWPTATLAQAAQATWQAHTDCPLRLVAGDNWLTGLVAYNLPQRPSVLIDGDYKLTPWVDATRLAREGVLLVWQADRLEATMQPLLRQAVHMQSHRLPWPRAPRLAPGQFQMAVVLPQDPACHSRR